MEVRYVVASKEAKKVVHLKKFFLGLKVIPLAIQPMTLSCDKKGREVKQFEKPKNHKKKKGKHIKRKYYLIHEIIQRGDVVMKNIPSTENLTNPFTKT